MLTVDYETATAQSDGTFRKSDGTSITMAGYRSGGYVILIVGGPGSVVFRSNICNMYKTGASTSEDMSCYLYNSSSEARLTFRDTSIDGWTSAVDNASLLNAFKTYVAEQYALGNILFVTWKVTQPITFQLSENQIATYLGVNNFWSNGNGAVDLEYRCDTKLYIENLTKPSEDDMTANANIASGKFFMVGNRLFLSTTAIAQGEQIVVGTNCSEVSLADALNQINA